jgi:hypothetical protein
MNLEQDRIFAHCLYLSLRLVDCRIWLAGATLVCSLDDKTKPIQKWSRTPAKYWTSPSRQQTQVGYFDMAEHLEQSEQSGLAAQAGPTELADPQQMAEQAEETGKAETTGQMDQMGQTDPIEHTNQGK